MPCIAPFLIMPLYHIDTEHFANKHLLHCKQGLIGVQTTLNRNTNKPCSKSEELLRGFFHHSHGFLLGLVEGGLGFILGGRLLC